MAGQARLVTAYNGTTKVATIAPPWVVTPTEGNTFVILPSAYLPGMEYATDGISNIQDVLLQAIETSITYATRGIDQILLGLETATDLIFDINANTVAAEVSLTYATRGIDQILLGLEYATDTIFDINANINAIETSITYATRGIDQTIIALQVATSGISDIFHQTATGGVVADVSSLLTSQMTEAYAADGTAPTLAQAIFMIQQMLGDFSISGTTLTVKKIDGSATAATYTLNSASSPTSITRAS